jgi:hypothetical protein
MSAGTDRLGAGASIGASAWTISGATTQVTLAEALSYGGSFADAALLVLTGGGKLVLNGSADFVAAVVDGTGTIDTTGTTSIAGLAVGGSVEFGNLGTLTESGGGFTLGDASGGVALLDNGGTWLLADDDGIALGGTSSSSVFNKGLIEKTGGTGASLIAPLVINDGVVEATSGTLEFSELVQGTGTGLIGSAGTLQFDAAVATTQTVTFGATTGTLVLDEAIGLGQRFAGTIAGFGGSDQIDLRQLGFSMATRLIWTQTSATAGTLAIESGSAKVTLALVGIYSSASFGQQQDFQGGTEIMAVPAAGQSSTGPEPAAAFVTIELPPPRQASAVFPTESGTPGRLDNRSFRPAGTRLVQHQAEMPLPPRPVVALPPVTLFGGEVQAGSGGGGLSLFPREEVGGAGFSGETRSPVVDHGLPFWQGV